MRVKRAPLVLELAALVLVPAACFAFGGVFDTTDPIWTLGVTAAGSSILAATLRRIGVPLPVASVMSLAALAAVLTVKFGQDTGFFGVVPNSETWVVAQELADVGSTQFRDLRSPVPPTDAFMALAIIGAWVMALLTDWGAMRLRLAFEPVLPAGLLFTFASVLGVASNEFRSTLIFAGAVLIWSVLQRTLRLRDHRTWLSQDIQRGPASIAPAAIGFGILAILGGLLIGPILPGANADEAFDFRTNGEPTRYVVSPFVKLDNRLVDQQDVNLFTVQASQPSYWRIAGLDTIEDGYWRTRRKFTTEDGQLPGLATPAGTTITLSQTINIQALAEIWLPAAFAPSQIESESKVRWNADTGSLSSDSDSSDGLTYTVESVIGLFTVEELVNADISVPPGDFADEYLEVPNDITPRMAVEAAEITASATSRYEQAKLLQDHFREYDYSTNLSPRVGDPIEQFLDERIGFCQQFSGTMALMARSLGIPARVAVGFTWGDPIAGQPDTYQITGRHTHAWPELWFGDLGWVAFEPTPGRGSPTSANYTEVPATQDSAVDPSNPPISTPTTAPPSTLPDDFIPSTFDSVPPPSNSGGGSTSINLPWRIIGIAAAVAAYVFGIPAWDRIRRASRQERGTTPSERVANAWVNATEDLELGSNLVRRPSETRTEFAQRCSTHPAVPAQVTQLAEITSNARYGPQTVTDSQAETAMAEADRINAAMVSSHSKFKLWMRRIDPRRVVNQLWAKRGGSSEDWTKAA